MRCSGLGGASRKVVGGFFGLFCVWFHRSQGEAPKPLNAGVSARGVSRALLIECKSLWRKA